MLITKAIGGAGLHYAAFCTKLTNLRPPAFGSPWRVFNSPSAPAGRWGTPGEAELFLELAGERVKGILLLQGPGGPGLGEM